MSFNTSGGNPRAHRISVYFEGSTTIYEGAPMCYNYDTTDNWHGGSIALTPGSDCGAVTSTGTTAESGGNEGKYIRVERPADGNLIHFAGVVAKGSWTGTSGPKKIDIYVPNGAIVPVRCDVDTTTGTTVLCIAEGEEELGFSNGIGTSRPVAIAMETETDLDSTATTTLAKLDPNLFLYQTLDGTAMDLGSGTGYGGVKVTTATTSLCWGPQFSFTNTGTGAGGFVGFRMEAHGAGTAIAGNVYALWAQSELDASGATTAGNIAGVWSKAYIPSTAGTISGDVFAIQLSLGLNKAITGDAAYILFDATTTSATTPDYLFKTEPDAGSACYTADTTCGADDKLGVIKVNVVGTDMYINLYSDTAS